MTSHQTTEADTWTPAREPHRFLLWVDGIGGFLVCMDARVTLGKIGDLALLADVSRQHASIQRDAEGYVLEATRMATVNGKPATRTLLRSGDRITLGSSCQLAFSQPVPISASARLDLVSGHRLMQPVSAVLLLAETLILGRGPQAHVLIDELERPIVLFRPKGGVSVRYGGNLAVNGVSYKDRAALPPDAKVVTDVLSFAIESV